MCVPRLTACLLIIAGGASCKTDRDRALALEANAYQALTSGDAHKAISLYDEALRLAPNEDAYLKRAQAWHTAGDDERAAESLKSCTADSCVEESRRLAQQALDGLGGRPLKDDVGVRRFLRLEQMAGESKACALILAASRTPKVDPASRRALEAVLREERGAIKHRLAGVDLAQSEAKSAVGFGATLGDATDCESINGADTGMARLSAVADEVGSSKGAGYDRATRFAEVSL